MIKRVTALFFISLANLILIGHAVIAHHHIAEKALVNQCCKSDVKADNYCTAEDNDHHNNNNDDDYCILKQLVVVRTNQDKHEFKCFDCTDNLPQFDGFQTILFDTRINGFFPLILKETKHIFLSAAYPYFASTCLGLRAPPAA
jgi:hypothetical protein